MRSILAAAGFETIMTEKYKTLNINTLEDYEKFNAVAGDHEGIVDIGRDIEGVEVSIFIREIKGKGLKVSLRSNDKVNVDEIALLYGGGGHPKAAGFSINDDLESVKQRVIAEAKRYL